MDDRDRRQFRRSQERIDVMFSSTNEFISAFTLNFGDGGLFLRTDKLLEVGDHLNIEFNLPESQYRIEAEAEVRWIRKKGGRFDGMGVSFYKISRGNYLKISSYLDTLGYPPCRLGNNLT